MFLVLRRILALAGVEEIAADRFSLPSARGLFLLHPVQTEAVAYVASRSENLSVLLVFAAYAIFLCRRTEAVSWARAAAVLLPAAAAVNVKEHAIVLPALLLLTDYYWNPGFSFQGIRRNWRLYVPLAAVAAVGLVTVHTLLGQATTAGFGIKGLAWYEYFFTQCRALFVYLRLFVLPFGQTVDYDFPVSRTVFDRGAIFGLAALVAISVAAWIWRRRYPVASFGWFAFLILMAPTSSFVPIQRSGGGTAALPVHVRAAAHCDGGSPASAVAPSGAGCRGLRRAARVRHDDFRARTWCGATASRSGKIRCGSRPPMRARTSSLASLTSRRAAAPMRCRTTGVWRRFKAALMTCW